MTNRKDLEFIRRLSYLLDSAVPIPGTPYRIGLDPILGLIPGIGDALTSAFSTIILVSAVRMKVSRWALTRMVFNILIESFVGIIPVVGDIFDAFWKSNQRNHRILIKSLEDPHAKAADVYFVVLLLIGFTLTMGLTAWAAFSLIRWTVAQF